MPSHRTVEALEDRTLFATLSIVEENQLPGTPQSDWYIRNDGDTSIQGFATDISVDQGQKIDFKVNNPSLAPYRLDIYRMGYYQGHGARRVATVPSTQTLRVNQPAPITNSTGLIDAGNWGVTASYQVPADATSGIYFANVVREDTGGLSQIIFIVRDDDGGSDMLFQTADATWQAYNAWGGKSLYVSTVDGGRAQKVSYNRPFTTRSTTFGGRDFVFGPEFAMVRFLESNGYDVSYSTNVDTARRGEEIKEHKAFLSVGHDEYWSGEMRSAVESARDVGVHLAFFSGNEVYWKVRWENAISADGTPYRTMVCYKETNANAKTDPSPEWTGTWRDPRFSPPSNGGRPENSLTGQLFTVNRGPGGETGTPFNVPAEFSQLRFWRNTSVANLGSGAVATLGDIVLGYEWDEDIDNGFRPAGLIRMSRTTQTVPQKLLDYGNSVGVAEATHTLTLYRAASGALVFGAGTVQWSYGLDGFHDGLLTTPDLAMRQATVNLFADMGVQPVTPQAGLLRATMSVDVAAPISAISGLNGTTVVAGVPITVTGSASDVGGGVVGGIEVSVDGGRTWHRASGRETWSYTWVPVVIGPATVLSRAADDSGNIQSAYGTALVTVTPQPTGTTGLVGAWSFDAGSGTTAADSSGWGNTGTLSGSTWTSGLFGSGLNFDGVNDWVTVNDSNSLDLTTGMTIEAWIRPTAGVAWRTVAMKESASGLSYALYSSNETGQPEVFLGRQSTFGTNPIPLNTWSHVAATYDGGLLSLYVNGTLVSESDVGNSMTGITPSSGVLRIGGNAVWGEYFRGAIDEMRIYNRPLTGGEIRVDMSTPINGTLEATPPSVSFSAPAGGSSVVGNIQLSVTATDNVGVSQVDYLLNGTLLGTSTSAPFGFMWNAAKFANGAYTLTARARDFAGNATTSSPLSVTVNNSADVTAPSVVLKHPIDGAHVSGLVPVWAVATDNIDVTQVQLQVDGVNVGTPDMSGPYQFVLDTATLSPGNHTLTVIARDAAGNARTSAPVTIVVDNSGAAVTARSPAPGSTSVPATTSVQVTFNEDVDSSTIILELRNSSGQLVSGLLSYNPLTDVATFTPSSPLSIGATYTVTLSRTRDLAGNELPSPLSWSFTTTATVSDSTIWNASATPAVPAASDTGAVELGVRFRSELNGYVTGVRFYKGAGNTGTHTGRLWTNDGQLLGAVTFANETASGWQQANFADPIAVLQGVTYVVSYHAPVGGYAINTGYFSASGFDGGVLEALANGVSGGNGVFRYGAGGVFPGNSANASNYWVDAVFSNSLADTTPPSITMRTPASAATNVNINSIVSARLSESVTESSISFVLRDGAGNAIPAAFGYDSTNSTVTLDPNVALAYNTTYTATLSGVRDAAGNMMGSTSWSFTTAVGPDLTAATVSARSPTPGTANVLVGVNVTATFDESIDPGTLVFELRNASNQLVAASVTYDPATQTATLDPTASLAASSSYAVSVRAADVSGNTMPSAATWTFTTEAPSVGNTIWPSTAMPSTPATTDTAAIELGVKFRTSTAGYVTGVRFYKGVGNTGTHVGRLWDAAGNMLATVQFADETATGWQQADFDTPVAVNAGQTYTVSYFAPVGRYAFNGGYFSGTGVTNGPLTALASGTDGGNGVYRYGAGGGFPSSSGNGGNYWVDVVFTNVLVDNRGPVVTARSPVAGAVNVSADVNVSATFDEAIRSDTLSFVLRDPAGNVVTASVTYDPDTRTAILNPSSNLTYETAYTATLSGTADTLGNVIRSVSWTFTTSVGPDVVAPSVVGSTPGNGATVAPATTVSVKLSESVQANTISLKVLDHNNVEVPANVTYNDADKSVTFRPMPPGGLPPGCCGNCSHCPLRPATTYTATLSGAKDLAGNMMAPFTWTFSTDPAITNLSFWNSSTTPEIATTADTRAVEVGMKFQVGTLGLVTGVRFYKGPGTPGTHVGRRWDSTGMLLATATFDYETATGWQEVKFDGSILVDPGKTYVVSYFAPNGGYSSTPSYFASAVTSGTLSTPSGPNGFFVYGAQGGFPNKTYNNANYWVDVVFSNWLDPDVTPPGYASRSPAPGDSNVELGANITATFNESLASGDMTFIVRDAAGNVVDGVFTYTALTRTATFDPTGTLAFGATYTATLSGATDKIGNVMGATTWSFTVTPPIVGGTIWNGTSTPAVAAVNDASPIEVGMKFRASESGYITGIRFYKGAGNGGTHKGRLWKSDGTLLASVTFTDESATGWQQATFAAPVAIDAGQTYIASYYAPVGRYASTRYYFAGTGITTGPLTALASGVDGANGVYRYGTGGGFPTSTAYNSNYWVDVLYSSLFADGIAPTATINGPSAGSIYVPVGSSASASFDEPIRADTISMVLRDASNNVVSAAASYDPVTRTVTLNPDADLVVGATYTISLSSGRDLAGNLMAPISWSFTTSAPVIGATLWDSPTPNVTDSGDNNAVELGVKFRADVDGYITGIRFYKGANNTGTHIGKLWADDGTLLASVTFTNETATGWQQANFSTPVAISAGRTYVASYYAPVGRYAATTGYFGSSAILSGPLTALGGGAGNGVYRYGVGGGFPTSSYGSTNYWVDVVFSSVLTE